MRHLLVLLKGLLIGIANVIPGVSGGTFALVLGIYDRLIAALKSYDLRAARVALTALATIHRPASRQALREEARRCDLVFLLLLALGAGLAIKGLAGLLQWLLAEQPMPTLAFFVGLIVPSIAIPLRMMERRGAIEAITCLLGIGLTLLVSLAQVSQGGGEPALWFVFVGGAAAIAAMILPGISGSFLLLVLGLYQPTLEHIHHLTAHSFVFLGVMALGFVFGLVTISRLMAFLLKRWRSPTLAFLIGLVLGSFYVLWPFKDFTPPASAPAAVSAAAPAATEKADIRIATAPNRLPASASEAAWPALFVLLGLVCSIGLNKLGASGEGGAPPQRPQRSGPEPPAP
ncbi:MAG: DUF368 domain-containing protein [Deltaproteobacteria bacterium]|nr:DUF368 domain-containing protein [Deltaproteobacteria bacterium]